MKEAVLVINYQVNGTLKTAPQGKFYYLNNEPVYLADIDDSKLILKYNAWGISKQITDIFSKTKTRPTIIYRDKRQATVFLTNLSTITGKHSKYDFMGGHSQWFLPRAIWQPKHSSYLNEEPMNLPRMKVYAWSKTVGYDPTAPLFSINDEESQEHEKMAIRSIMAG